MNTSAAPNRESRTRVLVVLLFLGLAGMVILAAGLLLESPTDELKKLTEGFLHLLGTTLFVAVCLSLIHEIYLKDAYLKDTTTAIQAVTEALNQKSAMDLRKVIKDEIAIAMPPKYSNIKQAGIVDAYSPLHMDRWRQRIDSLTRDNIRILNMWIDDFHALETSLHDAVAKRDCTVRVMLLHPLSGEAIKKRADTLHRLSADYIMQEIQQNLKTLYSTWHRLSSEKKGNFQVRLHRSFIAVSLHGLADEYVFGLYLRGRLATQGTQIKVHGADHPLYRELDAHFEEEWKIATAVDFEAYAKNDFVLPELPLDAGLAPESKRASPP